MKALDRREQIDTEHSAFRAMLPELLEAHEGQHVVFQDGEPRSFHDRFDEAVSAALREYGLARAFAVFTIESDDESRRAVARLRGKW